MVLHFDRWAARVSIPAPWIKRGMHMVGLVRWCRNHPRIKENLSGGLGFVRWGRIGLWEEMWEF